MSMKKKKGWRCKKCKSEALRFDATAIWNKDLQTFELDYVNECGEECSDCSCEWAEEYTYE